MTPRPAALPLADHAPEKTREGEPCNGCGFCCAIEPCAIAKDWLGAEADAPCPALEFKDDRFWCGMIRGPSHYLRLPNDWGDRHLGAQIAKALGAGRGCDASDP